MKLLAFADMHGSRKALAEIKIKAANADIILCCGDLTIFEQNMKTLLRQLSRLGKSVLMIPGNHEVTGTLRKECKRHPNLVYMDGETYETENHLFMGAEGNGFAFIDKGFERMAKQFIVKIKNTRKTVVLMTHAPPYNTRLDLLSDGHCGNKSIREFILRAKPDFAFSGHIHENYGKKDKLGKTILINPAPTGQIVRV